MTQSAKPTSDSIALFDLDGTLADYETQLRRDLDSIRRPDDPDFDLHSDELPEWFYNRIVLIRQIPGWWARLPRLQRGFEILAAAQEVGFDIHVLSKGPESAPNAWTEKFEWCRQHLPPSVSVCLTRDKSTVYGRVLVDDYHEYVLGWLTHRPRGLVIMPITTQSTRLEHPQVICYDGTNMAQVRRALQAAHNRAAFEELVF